MKFQITCCSKKKKKLTHHKKKYHPPSQISDGPSLMNFILSPINFIFLKSCKTYFVVHLLIMNYYLIKTFVTLGDTDYPLPVTTVSSVKCAVLILSFISVFILQNKRLMKLYKSCNVCIWCRSFG